MANTGNTIGFYSIITILILATVVIFRTVLLFPQPIGEEQCDDDITHGRVEYDEKIIKRFIDILSFPTITRGRNLYDAQQLIKLTDYIQQSYPYIHSSSFIKVEKVANYSLVYTITGTEKSLQPYMLCAHLDVVPASAEDWKSDPFKPSIREGSIYARGTIDYKNGLTGILEALEAHLKAGFRPRRSFFVSFGHDEEGNGIEGAQAIAELLSKRGIRLKYIIDEGTFIVNETFPGVHNLIAMIGVGEKGLATFELTTTAEAGHASMPPYETAIVVLSKALAKFNARTHPSMFGTSIEKDIFESIAPFAALPYKIVYSNLWLFGPLLSYLTSLNPMGNSLVRTTTAVTMVKGGLKENINPKFASALINHRIHSKQSVEEVLDFDRRLVDDNRIKIKIKGLAFNPHPISDYSREAFGYGAIKSSIRQIYNGIVVVPGLMVASTDTKWYLKVSDDVYRFSPVVMRPGEIDMFHGRDERIRIDNYMKLVNFYHHLFAISDKETLNVRSQIKQEL